MPHPAVRPAATVVVVRNGEEALEVFLVKRHRKSKFMGQFYVFPGGRVDASDGEWFKDGNASLGTMHDGAWEADMDEESPSDSAFAFAAIRETAEESGILLAQDAHGNIAGHDVAEAVFNALKAGQPFIEILAHYSLTPTFSAIHPLAWWVTPSFETYRYNTRFYLAAMPPSQRASYDELETTDGVWMTAQAALDAWHDEKIMLAPPTVCNLELLVGAVSPEEVLARTTRPIYANLPEVIAQADGDKFLVVPGDELHPTKQDAPAHRTRFRILGPGRFR